MSWQQRDWYEEVTEKIKIDWEQFGNQNLTAEMRSRRLEVALSVLEELTVEWRLTDAELRRRYRAIENQSLSVVRQQSR